MATKAAKRTFTISGSDNGVTGGHYTGTSPSQAAKKAANELFKKAGSSHTGKLQFLLRESTQGSDKKTFAYAATQKILDPPLKVMIAGKEVSISKKVEVKAEKVRAT